MAVINTQVIPEFEKFLTVNDKKKNYVFRTEKQAKKYYYVFVAWRNELSQKDLSYLVDKTVICLEIGLTTAQVILIIIGCLLGIPVLCLAAIKIIQLFKHWVCFFNFIRS